MTEQLLNCPFCGGRGIVVGDNTSRVQCQECCASTDRFCDVEPAIAAWSRRATEPRNESTRGGDHAGAVQTTAPVPGPTPVQVASLLDGECYRRALVAALSTKTVVGMKPNYKGTERAITEMIEMADKVATMVEDSERERRKP